MHNVCDFESHMYFINMKCTFKEGLNGGGGGPLFACRLKFSHFVGSRLKFSIFVDNQLKFSIFDG